MSKHRITTKIKVEVPDKYTRRTACGKQVMRPHGGAFAKGAIARLTGVPRKKCPYDEWTMQSRGYAKRWLEGWDANAAKYVNEEPSPEPTP